MKVLGGYDLPSPDKDTSYKGDLLTDASYDVILSDQTTKLVDVNNDVIAVFLKAKLNLYNQREAWLNLRAAAIGSDRRASATGKEQGTSKTSRMDGKVMRAILAKESLPKTGQVGSFERYKLATGMMPCRLTAFTRDHFKNFQLSIPFLQDVSQAFCEYAPDRHAVQAQHAATTHKEYMIPETIFTTVTVNRNWQTAAHQDAGDLKAGLSCLAVYDWGKYSGGLLVLPRYRVAFDIRAGDLLVFNANEWHGNTPIESNVAHERCSFVCYFREKIQDCKSPEAELQEVKHDPAQPKYDI